MRITIDDGPSKLFKKRMEFLIRNGFEPKEIILFCIGKKIREQKEDVVWAIKQGFVIGNHSYDHPKIKLNIEDAGHCSFSALTIESIKKEIENTEKIIDECYKTANVKRIKKYFRFPYLDEGNIEVVGGSEKKRDEVIIILKKFGLEIMGGKGVNDWKKDSKEKLKEIYERIEKLKPEDKVIIHDLFEDEHNSNIFNKIIRKLKTN